MLVVRPLVSIKNGVRSFEPRRSGFNRALMLSCLLWCRAWVESHGYSFAVLSTAGLSRAIGFQLLSHTDRSTWTKLRELRAGLKSGRRARASDG
jgi:hypothetical protein